MHRLSLLILTTLTLTSHATTPTPRPPVLHFTIARRGGAFPTENIANLTFLTDELARAEARFNLTRREVRGNKLVRKAKARGVGGREEGKLMGDLGLGGRWYGFRCWLWLAMAGYGWLWLAMAGYGCLGGLERAGRLILGVL